MKNTIIQMIMIVGLVACSALFAEAQNSGLYRTEIPFDFSVGEKSYPAGTYSIEVRGFEKKFFVLRDSDGRNSYALNTMPGRSNGDSAAALDFNRVGDQYFLAAIRVSDRTSTLTRSKRESLLSRNAAEVQTVSIAVSRGK
jgi:hypothetical protein